MCHRESARAFRPSGQRAARAPLIAWVTLAAGCASSPDLPPVVGDGMPSPLTTLPGRADEGRRVVADRQVGLCLLCHSGPFPEVRFQGNIAADLGGAGSRWSEAQLRLRLVDPARVNPQTLMPAYGRRDGLTRVGQAWRGKPVLQPQQIEDVVAYLRTLK
jgi:sulfur-oxidizing protein SoxX